MPLTTLGRNTTFPHMSDRSKGMPLQLFRQFRLEHLNAKDCRMRRQLYSLMLSCFVVGCSFWMSHRHILESRNPMPI